jgi:hypothetical protein
LDRNKFTGRSAQKYGHVDNEAYFDDDPVPQSKTDDDDDFNRDIDSDEKNGYSGYDGYDEYGGGDRGNYYSDGRLNSYRRRYSRPIVN